jgi:hypothetical protein
MPKGKRLHFGLWQELRFGFIEPSPAALIRAAFNGASHFFGKY